MKISYPPSTTTNGQIERVVAALNRIDKDNLSNELDLEQKTVKMPYTVVNRVRDKSGYVCPVGVVDDYAGSTAPEGFLLCDGSAISRATYSDLFSVIGVTFGAGDGSTTFNIPHLHNVMIMGAGDTYALASTGGAATVTLDVTMIPSHTHIANSHFHTIPSDNAGTPATGDCEVRGTTSDGSNVSTDGTVVTLQNTGGGLAHNNLSPYLALHRIIKF